MAARVRARRSEPISARLARFTRAIAVPTCVWSRLYGQNDFCRPGGFVPRSPRDRARPDAVELARERLVRRGRAGGVEGVEHAPGCCRCIRCRDQRTGEVRTG